MYIPAKTLSQVCAATTMVKVHRPLARFALSGSQAPHNITYRQYCITIRIEMKDACNSEFNKAYLFIIFIITWSILY